MIFMRDPVSSRYLCTVPTAIFAASSFGNINTPVDMQQNAMESSWYSSANLKHEV